MTGYVNAYKRKDVVIPQAGSTCSRESCFSLVEILAFSSFLMRSSSSKLSVFSPSSLVNFAHSWRSLASSVFCLKTKWRTEMKEADNQSQEIAPPLNLYTLKHFDKRKKTHLLSAWLVAWLRASRRMEFSCCRRASWALGPFSSWSCRLRI